MKNLNSLMSLLFLSIMSQAEVQIANMQQFNKQVLASNQPVIAKFSADYCPACKQAKPIFTKLSNDPDFKGIMFVSVDTEKNSSLSQQYNIQGIPSFIIFNNGKVIDKQEGLRGDLKQQLLKGLQKARISAPAALAPTVPATPSTGAQKKRAIGKKVGVVIPTNEAVLVEEVVAPPAQVIVVEENPAPVRNLVKDSAATTGNFFTNVGNTISSWFN